MTTPSAPASRTVAIMAAATACVKAVATTSAALKTLGTGRFCLDHARCLRCIGFGVRHKKPVICVLDADGKRAVTGRCLPCMRDLVVQTHKHDLAFDTLQTQEDDDGKDAPDKENKDENKTIIETKSGRAETVAPDNGLSAVGEAKARIATWSADVAIDLAKDTQPRKPDDKDMLCVGECGRKQHVFLTEQLHYPCCLSCAERAIRNADWQGDKTFL